YINTLTLYGGGFGHGVGMSQDGVKGMATRGYTYREILRHYYPQIEIKSQEA
ncbi:MAG: SpoIID/LytB domain protein, partial [Clostridia bacterium]|nr:SpoIID/LytB domain protein [Clostridia bacterium]